MTSPLPTSKAPLPRSARARTVTAVLGPTNTGKTHLAIERMLGNPSGAIGLPLRLLAREVYGRAVARVGPEAVALITGEEKILPPEPRYFVCTVEAMPDNLDTDFVAIDEVQLAGDLERGRVFTDRLLNLRGRHETLLLGAATARPILEKLLPGLNVVTRPRMSVLSYSGSKKLTRLPPRSAVVAFSANEVYAIAELIRRQRGGAAIVMGALSPRTRNAQVDLFQSGDVEFLIATDAIGMGLNLDVDHVAFASSRKFDGYQFRELTAAELAQIAGRAGRHTRDGTFGVTARVEPFADELVEQLETHRFAPVKVLQWRNANLDFSSVPALRHSLDEVPQEDGLTRAPPGDDLVSLDHAMKSAEAMELADRPQRIALLWEVCKIPDYRKIAPANHADLVLSLFGFLATEGRIPDDWFARQVRYSDNNDGDIDTLSNRIAHIRTWTYIANRPDWLDDPAHWRDTTRAIEDRLSDALHERLTQRFVDRRTSVLMQRLRDNEMLDSEVNDAGEVRVEGQHVGSLLGFQFVPVAASESEDRKALRAAAAKALVGELDKRAERLAAAPDAAFTLDSDGAIRWQGAAVARLVATDDILAPRLVLLAEDGLTGASRERAEARLAQWLDARIKTQLKPLFDLKAGASLEGVARGVAFQLSEALGLLDRREVGNEVKALEQTARSDLRAIGVRFGAHHIFVPALLKPGPSGLLALLWALKNAAFEAPGVAELPQLSSSGRTSVKVDPEIAPELYRVVGFRVLGHRAVRVDILERLADQIRPLVAWRPSAQSRTPPPGGIETGGGFTVTVAMTSLLGCSGEEFASVLKALGYRLERREVPRPAVPPKDQSCAPAAGDVAVASAATRSVAPSPSPPPVPVPSRPAAERETTDGLVGALADTDPVATDGDALGAFADDTTPGRPDHMAGEEVAPAAAAVVEASAASSPSQPSPAGAGASASIAPGSGEAAEVASDAATAPSPALEGAEPDAGAAPGEAAGLPDTIVIEIWRPQRHYRGDRRGKPQRREDRGGGRQRQGAGRDGRRAEADAAGGTDNAASGRSDHGTAAAAEAHEADAKGARPGRSKKDRKRSGRGDERRRGDERERKDGPRREMREPVADPDSPFAKLAALKADLEKQARER